MATLCMVIAVGNNAWLADWCRLLIIRTLAVAIEPERRGRHLVRSDAVARPPQITDARGCRRHANRVVRSSIEAVAARGTGRIRCRLSQRLSRSGVFSDGGRGSLSPSGSVTRCKAARRGIHRDRAPEGMRDSRAEKRGYGASASTGYRCLDLAPQAGRIPGTAAPPNRDTPAASTSSALGTSRAGARAGTAWKLPSGTASSSGRCHRSPLSSLRARRSN